MARIIEVFLVILIAAILAFIFIDLKSKQEGMERFQKAAPEKITIRVVINRQGDEIGYVTAREWKDGDPPELKEASQ